MINRFIDDVVSQGAEAVLPQNLDPEWLDTIYVAARSFLQMTMAPDDATSDEEILSDEGSLMMLSAVVEVGQHLDGYGQDGEPVAITEDEVFERISCYALAVILEWIARETELELPVPTVDDIFDRERLFEIEQEFPDLTEILNKLIAGM